MYILENYKLNLANPNSLRISVLTLQVHRLTTDLDLSSIISQTKDKFGNL